MHQEIIVTKDKLNAGEFSQVSEIKIANNPVENEDYTSEEVKLLKENDIFDKDKIEKLFDNFDISNINVSNINGLIEQDDS